MVDENMTPEMGEGKPVQAVDAQYERLFYSVGTTLCEFMDWAAGKNKAEISTEIARVVDCLHRLEETYL